ncbi:MAG: GntR family transcriptional regulator [Treponema sp.]|nr:GntR family transcriptional regulator [Treponema sp.]
MKNIEKLDKESNRDYALRVIRENIINLELKPGTMISEQDIANELNLSRTPVHEAMQELATTKIIEILPQRGSYVSKIDMDRVDEAIFMRTTLESAIAKLACEKANDEDLLELEENLNLQEFYLEKNNLDKFMELDNAFHQTMYRIANKMQCFYMVKLMNIHHDRIRELHIHSSNPKTVISEHMEILEAFKKHDGDKAHDLLVAHITRLYQQQGEIRKKYPEYFE